MATKRQKKQVITGVTREAAEEAFGQYAKARSQAAKCAAEIELACSKIREKYQERLAALTEEQDKNFEVLLAYAAENRDTLFAKKKSLEMLHGTIGYRIGMPKLKTLKGHTWASALELVKAFAPDYIRQTEEVAKDKLLADRDVPAEEWPDGVSVRELMARCGITVVQDESFYVEPRQEGGEA